MTERTTVAPGRQAAKSQQTRAKILSSAISLIREGGFQAASAARIAERAGLSWGAAQHHFGSKEEILDAVMAISHERFIATVHAPDLRQGSLESRAGRFVDLMWRHYQDDVYLAALEILLANRTATPGENGAPWFDRRARDHVEALREIFHDCDVADERLQEALLFVHCILTGLTVEKVLEGRLRFARRHVERAKFMLLTMLQES